MEGILMKLWLSFTLALSISLSVSAAPLTVTEQAVVIELVDREYYAIPYLDQLFIDEGKLKALLEKLDRTVTKEPIDARIDDQDRLIEEVSGVSLDEEKFTELFLSYFYGEGATTIEVPKLNVHPRVSSELLSEINAKKIGHYVTYYNTDNEERSHNIYLSTMAINNQVIFPGEIFSFNQTVGERTVNKGYKKAPVIVKGELAEDIGGGICQVSSTLFNAVNLRGIQMVERYSHSRSVPYVPPGKDATVSWWGPDFVFKNKYSHPILIQATSEDGIMEIHIYSAEDVHLK